jgi:cysteinyl-tRNA synthetase
MSKVSALFGEAGIKSAGELSQIELGDRTASGYLENFDSALADDLNTPRALAEFRKLLKDSTIKPAQKLKALAGMDQVLGLDIASVLEISEEKPEIDGELLVLLKQRDKARKERNWALADSIRDRLSEQGWKIIDTPEGARLEKI